MLTSDKIPADVLARVRGTEAKAEPPVEKPKREPAPTQPELLAPILWRDRGNGCYESLVKRGLAFVAAGGSADDLVDMLDAGGDWDAWLKERNT